MLRVEPQLVELSGSATAAGIPGIRIEDTLPGALAGRITPPRGADADVRLCGQGVYFALSKPNVTFDPRIRIGRLMRFGCSIIKSIASFFDFGSGRCLNTGLRVLTKSRKWSA